MSWRSWHNCARLYMRKEQGGRRWDCLISTVWERLWTLKRVSCVLKALGLYTFTKIKNFKKKKKKAQLVTGWSGFSIHFKEMTYIIFLLWIKKGTSYIFPSIINIYRTYAFMTVYVPACFTYADILLYIVSIYMFLIAEEHNYICQFRTKSWRQGALNFFSSNSQHPPVLHLKLKSYEIINK